MDLIKTDSRVPSSLQIQPKSLPDGVVPWTFQKDLEKRKEEAQDMITRHKQALYQLRQLETKQKLAQKERDDLQGMMDKGGEETRSLYNVLLEENKQKITVYESQKEKYKKQMVDFDETECMTTIQNCNKYLEGARAFIHDNDLHDILDIKQVMDQSSMEEYVLTTYTRAKVTYESYKDLTESWLYNNLPFTRPWNYKESLDTKVRELLKSIDKIQRLVGYFPQVKERLMFEENQSNTLLHIKNVMDNVMKGKLTMDDFKDEVLKIKGRVEGEGGLFPAIQAAESQTLIRE
jgi:hypothetical protein